MFGFRFSMAPLLALIMFAASAGVVWLAHIEAGEMVTARQPPLVKASTTPLKRSPKDPGGSEVADLGGVRDLLGDQPADAEERLLPRAEKPVTPADADGANGRGEANAALEALVSELDNGRSGNGETGVGGPNPEEPVSFPSPSRPAGSTDEPVTPRGVTGVAGETPAAANAAPEETAVAALSQTFEATTGGRYRVQLAAVRAEEDAKRAWTLFQEQLGPYISGLQPFFERAETSNGVFYRVQIGPFGETSDADRLCVELKKQDASCFVVSR